MITIEGKLRRPVINWLQSLAMTPVFEVYLGHGTCDIVGVQWGERVGRSLPATHRIVAVELKMEDVAGVMYQAENNRRRIGESYAAMPKTRIDKMRAKTVGDFALRGLGLISVADDSVKILTMPVVNLEVFSDYGGMKRKLWRRRDEWVSRIDRTKWEAKYISTSV